jgi:hypothetical protein
LSASWPKLGRSVIEQEQAFALWLSEARNFLKSQNRARACLRVRARAREREVVNFVIACIARERGSASFMVACIIFIYMKIFVLFDKLACLQHTCMSNVVYANAYSKIINLYPFSLYENILFVL